MPKRPNRGTRRKPPEPKKNGRPPHQPTDQLRTLIKWLRVGGYSEEKVAVATSLSGPTLRKYYRKELDESRAEIHAMVGSSIVLNAIGGEKRDWEKANMSAAIFYAKTQMGWKEPKQEVAHSGTVGVYDPSKLRDLSDEDLAALERVATRLALIGPAAGTDPGGDSA
jgi:hypothetical protein